MTYTLKLSDTDMATLVHAMTLATDASLDTWRNSLGGKDVFITDCCHQTRKHIDALYALIATLEPDAED